MASCFRPEWPCRSRDMAPVLHHPAVARSEGAFGRPRPRRQGGLRERPPQPFVPAAGAARSVFARALVVAGADPHPTGAVARRGEDAHVDPELGDDRFGGALVDTVRRRLRAANGDLVDDARPGRGLASCAIITESIGDVSIQTAVLAGHDQYVASHQERYSVAVGPADRVNI